MNKALEDLQAGRDPFAPSRDGERGEFYQSVAKWSKWLVILAGVLSFVVSHTLSEAPTGDPSAQYVRVGTGWVCMLMFVVSLVLGVVALCVMRRHGSEGILRPALTGVCISAFCIYLFGDGFLRGYRNARARAELNEKINQIRARERMYLTNNSPITTESELKKINEAQSILDHATQNSSGDQALLSQAMSAYLTRTKVELARFAKAADPIGDVADFDMRKVNHPEDLNKQIQQVKNFMAANEKLLEFVNNSDNLLIGELQKVHLPQNRIDEAMKGYRFAIEGQNDLAIKIRLQDRRFGEALLGTLGLLADNWGKWKYSTEKKTVLFEDHTVWKKYIGYLDELEAAQKEETSVQRQLYTLKSKQR